VGAFFGNFRPRKAPFPFRVSFFLDSRDAPPQMNQRTSWLFVCGWTRDPEVLYPTDLSSGYKTGPEYRKTAGVRGGIGSKWPNMGLQHPARYTCLGGVLESCLGVYDYSGFHFGWSLRSKPSRSTVPPPPTQPNSHLLQAPGAAGGHGHVPCSCRI
jgi:hypothetical protein